MTDDFTHVEHMEDVVGIRQTGVPCGLVNRRIEPGYVLANGTVLLESEKDEDGRYIGGAGMEGMYLRGFPARTGSPSLFASLARTLSLNI